MVLWNEDAWSSKCGFDYTVSRSRLNENLDRFAIVHSTVAVAHSIETYGAIKDGVRINPTFDDVGQEDIGAKALSASISSNDA